MADQSIHQFTVIDTQGNNISLDQFKGKVLLIINTASKCGFTPQLADMQLLHEAYKGQDFEILAFPSNDFGAQEPLEGEELAQFCLTQYDAAYKIFEKVQVKGEDAIPLFKFLSQKKLNGKINSSPKWNFHKYLINKEGTVVDYYLSITKPTSKKIIGKINSLL